MTLPSSSPEPALLAAVDLGSNSFHMVVAQEWGTELRL
jgi:exopolyphosphatase/pppGpp-phosphohydrolase